MKFGLKKIEEKMNKQMKIEVLNCFNLLFSFLQTKI